MMAMDTMTTVAGLAEILHFKQESTGIGQIKAISDAWIYIYNKFIVYKQRKYRTNQ